MGAIDLVIQIEAPPSVASGMQRIGRAGHTIGAASRGIIVPKFRGDLVACAAVTRAMHEAQIESTRYPRNPLDVLAQQIVAMVSMDHWTVDEPVRRRAPRRAVRRARPRHVRRRARHAVGPLSVRRLRRAAARASPGTASRTSLTAREGARRVAVINGGTIPDRGLYGVFLAGEHGPGARVGELDEEMVFESRVGETFLLGASTWRIERDHPRPRARVSGAGRAGQDAVLEGRRDRPAAGVRPRRSASSCARCVAMPPAAAVQRLVRHHDLDAQAAENLLRYLADQTAAAGVVPDDRTVVVERCRDELGDWRVCVLSPFGGRIHAPWAMAVVERVARRDRARRRDDVDRRRVRGAVPGDRRAAGSPADAARRPRRSRRWSSGSSAARRCSPRSSARPRAARCSCPGAGPAAAARSGSSANAPADLLAVASRVRLVSDGARGLSRVSARRVRHAGARRDAAAGSERREIRVATVDSTTPSPFAAALLFGYVANYLYDGDAPLAERRAQALSIDQAQLRELLGEIELRELLDADAIADVERQLQQLDGRSPGADRRRRARPAAAPRRPRRSRKSTPARSIDGRRARRRADAGPAGDRGHDRRRGARSSRSNTRAAIATRLGVPLPPGLPEALLEPAPHAALDLARRYARTHGPFTADEFAARYGLGRSTAEALLKELAAGGPAARRRVPARRHGTRVVRPGRAADDPPAVAREAAAQVEPVEPARARPPPHALAGRRPPARGPRRAARRDRGPAGRAARRVDSRDRDPAGARRGLQPADLDALTAAGEVVWCGLEPLGERDGRLALYLTDHVARLRRQPHAAASFPNGSARSSSIWSEHGASFFAALHEAAGGGYPGETVDAHLDLVWAGAITNDTLQALRAFTRPAERKSRKPQARPAHRAFRSRRMAPPSAEGRWSLDDRAHRSAQVSATECRRPRSRSSSSPLRRADARGRGGRGHRRRLQRRLRRPEGARGRRAHPPRLLRRAASARRSSRCRPRSTCSRSLKELPDEPEVVVLAATDPANPYGTILRGPSAGPADGRRAGRGPTRRPARSWCIVNGALAAYISRGARQLLAFLPEDEPARSTTARAVATHAGAARPARPRDQRLPGRRTPAGAVPGRSRLQPLGHGLPDPHGGFGRGA